MALPVASRSGSPVLQPPGAPHNETRSARIVAIVLLVAMISAYAGLFAWLSLRQYMAYWPHALDLGNMGQATWNTLHGHPFFFTNMRLPYDIEAWRTTTRLSFHVEALFPLISLLYLIDSSPQILLVVQTLALAAGAMPVYLLAHDQLRNRWLAILFALAYLLFPALQAMNLYEFHPVSLATPLLLFGFWCASRRLYLPFVVCALAAMGTKEEIGLVVAVMALYLAVTQRTLRLGLSLAAFAAFYSLFAALVVEHHYRQPGTLSYVHTRYSYLGHGIHGALHVILHDPSRITGLVFTLPKLRYLVRLLAPVGFLALLSPAALAIALPTIALDLFSQEPHMYSALGDNAAEVIAVVMIASILGAKRLLRILEYGLSVGGAEKILALLVALFALWTQHAIGFLPGSAEWAAPAVGAHQRLADSFVAGIPPGAPVSTQDQLDPHLSSRHFLYLFADTGRDAPPMRSANRILLDASAATYPLPSYQLHDYAENFIRKPGWGIARARDGLILIQKGATRKTPPSSFYTYMEPHGKPSHSLRGTAYDFRVLGYDLRHTDRANQYPANLEYDVYLHTLRTPAVNLQPIIYAVMDNTPIDCQTQPLGLAWFPTSRWAPSRTYVIRMPPMQIDWQSFGTAQIYIGFHASPIVPASNQCGVLWASHGALWRAGQVTIGF